MKCFYHNDIDGLSSAAFVARFTNNYNPDDYIMHDYSKPLPVDLVKEEETVYVVDLSFSPNTINELKEIVEKKRCKLIWCDHHSSTMELLKEYPEYNTIEGLRQEGISGAALTWMYFEDCSFEECPKFIRMISDFDCWKFEIPGTIQFKYSLESEELTPFSVVWNNLVRDSKIPANPLLHNMIDRGFTIENYMKQWFSNYCRDYSYETDLAGYKCLVCNIRANSLVFGELIHDYPVVAIWVYDGSIYKYSIYTDKDNVDCSKIAESFGGGGHKQAAGFVSKERII